MLTIRLIAVACSLMFLVSCSAHVPQQSQVVSLTKPSVQDPGNPEERTLIRTARSLVGAPYRYGGTSPGGFDCSGLAFYVYQRAGIRIPRTSTEQYRRAEKVPFSNLRAGDLLFFRLDPPKISHVGIYDRNGRFIHAPSSGQAVGYATLDNPYWQEHLVAAGRF